MTAAVMHFKIGFAFQCEFFLVGFVRFCADYRWLDPMSMSSASGQRNT